MPDKFIRCEISQVMRHVTPQLRAGCGPDLVA